MQIDERIKGQEFQVWTIEVENNVGTVTCKDGNGNMIYQQGIPFTDFPLSKLKFYFADGVILLPSEY